MSDVAGQIVARILMSTNRTKTPDEDLLRGKSKRHSRWICAYSYFDSDSVLKIEQTRKIFKKNVKARPEDKNEETVYYINASMYW